MIELITGADGTAHVSSADDGALYASIVGTGSYSGKGVGEGLALFIKDNNHLVLGTGCGWHNGRGWRVTSQHDVVVQSGTQAQRRADLVVARYSVDGDREKMEVVTLKGEPVADSAQPEYPAHEEGSVLDGARVSDMPLYGVKLNGLNIEGTEKMFTEAASLSDLMGLAKSAQESIKSLDERASAIERKNADQDAAIGGKAPTSHSHTAGQVTDLKAWLLNNVFKVGYVWMSYTNTSPASILGGSWAALTGVFPYFNNGTGTGGSNTHTLSVSEMPSHRHAQNIGEWTAVVGDYHDNYALNQKSSGHYANTSYSPEAWIQATKREGGGSAHNNMPRYQTLYAWRRTA